LNYLNIFKRINHTLSRYLSSPQTTLSYIDLLYPLIGNIPQIEGMDSYMKVAPP